MYYHVAKTRKGETPLIIKTFKREAEAFMYANTMNKSNKGNFIVFGQTAKENKERLKSLSIIL